MQPEINVLGLSIKTFGLFFALNFVAWGALVGRRLRELGKPVDWAYEMVAAALLGGLIGARGYWLLQNHESFSIGSVLGGSGLIWYGGLLGGVVFVLLWARWRGFLTLALVDMAGPGLALGYAIGRIGCQLSGDGDYGKAWDGPWAISYGDGIPRHPAPLYEMLFNIAMGFVLLALCRRQILFGRLFALYLLCYGVFRFLIEFIRDTAKPYDGLSAYQLMCIVMIVAGAWALIARSRRQPESWAKWRASGASA